MDGLKALSRKNECDLDARTMNTFDEDPFDVGGLRGACREYDGRIIAKPLNRLTKSSDDIHLADYGDMDPGRQSAQTGRRFGVL